MISTEVTCAELARHKSFVSTVELAMILKASVSEVKQRLRELGERVTCNEQDEWRITGSLVGLSSESPLSASDVELKNQLENTVSQAFFVADRALKELRDKRLYRETHTTFESYVQDQFGYKKSAAYYLISAAEVVDNLKRPQFVDKNQSQIILPTSESQCRPIAKLPFSQQREVWSEAVERASGKVPPARIIKQVVKELKGGKLQVQFIPQPKPGEGECPLAALRRSARTRCINTPGLGNEYAAYLREETYFRLKDYQQRIGKATLDGAIWQLLEQENQKDYER